MPVRIVAIINQKGGVGKTTTTANLAHALARMSHKVTVVDLDPQGHLGLSLGVDPNSQGLDEVLLGDAEIENQLLQVRENLQLIPAGRRLQELEQLHEGGAERGSLLRIALDVNV